MEPNDWQEVPYDPETVAMWRLLPAANHILEGPRSPLELPQWVKDLAREPRRIDLCGREGAETLDAWRAQTEETIAALLDRRPWGLLHVLALLRRLPNDRFFLGEQVGAGGPRRFDPFQADVTERAALKYARWDASGVDLEPGRRPGIESLAQERPSVDEGRAVDILSLVQLGAVWLAYLERMRRSIVHGNKVTLRTDGFSDSEPEPWFLKRLVLYGARFRRFSFLGESAGVLDASTADDLEADSMLATHAVRTTYREDEGEDWWRYELSRRLIRKRDKRFIVSRARGLEPAYEYLKLLEEEVVAQYEFTPELIVSALMGVHEAVERFVAPEGMSGTLIETFAKRIAYLDTRGYLIVRDDVMDDVILGALAAEAHRREFPESPTPAGPDETFAHGLKRLAYLDSYDAEDLKLEDGKPWVRRYDLDGPVPMPTPFVYSAGDHKIVDLNAVGHFLQGIVDCLILEEAPRQRVSRSLEQRLGDYFDRKLPDSHAFEPSKKLRVPGAGHRGSRVVAELDVSAKIGSVLVAVDAKSLQVSPGYRGYVHADVRNRWQKFESYVAHADEQAQKLANQPNGTNYDLLAEGYTHVVTLLCSTVVEYIDTDDANFFIQGDLPRVATPAELRNYLAGATEEDLKALPFAKRLGGS